MTNKEITLAAIRDLGRSDALALADAISAGELTDTQIIDAEEKVPAFDGSKDYTGYSMGFAVTDGEQVFGLLQPHNAANYPDMGPADLTALWGLKHTKNPDKAKPFVSPVGTSGMYMKDECCIYDGSTYISLCDNNAFSPAEYPGNWHIKE